MCGVMENGVRSLQVSALGLLVSLASVLWKGSELAEGTTCSHFAWSDQRENLGCDPAGASPLCSGRGNGSSTRWLCPAGVGVSGRTWHQLLGKPKVLPLRLGRSRRSLPLSPSTDTSSSCWGSMAPWPRPVPPGPSAGLLGVRP